MTDGHLFGNILLGGRGGTNPGQLRVYSGGIVWKKQGGGKVVEVDKSDILSLSWLRLPRSFQLGVKAKDGLFYKFTGFREQDVNSLTSFFQRNLGITPEEKQLSISGHNWGDVELDGNTLTFLVESKQAFEISLADVSQAQLQGKNDVVLQFHVDDTTGANEKDSLMELTFHIPNSNTQFVGDESRPPAQVFHDKIVTMTDVGSTGEEPVVTFEGIAILTPRGRYSVELHHQFMRLQGQANDFKIQYSSVVRLFLLPKFETEFVVESNLSLSEEQLSTKYKGKLEAEYKGFIHEVFTSILRGLSGAKITRPGKFRSCLDGYAVKSSLKAEDGVLYPLEKGFFFLPKPPTLILYDDIEYVEFERHGAGGSSVSSIILILFGKGMKIMNLGDMQTTTGVAAVLQQDDDDAVDPHLERIRNEAGGEESDEEDEDFVADKDDGGSPTDDSGGEESDASESGDEKEKPDRKEAKKEATTSKPAPVKRRPKDGDEDGSKKKKPKKKKDPNAPKRAMSAFMMFSNSERENLKKTNPGLSFTDVGRALGEKWKKMTASEKEPFEAMANADKKRYKDEMAGYDKSAPVGMDSGAETDSS
ncbi:FACT complex subunit SSRP1 [Acorus calamus]|uniref:FACT complex subunit SSRP1 n=1 Tax=Acorus calamus TaxID=4465 RepID=A0AAV9DCC0_ACOCL|nr:FACT complex subunit SSRP1 [Acorus calamus]